MENTTDNINDYMPLSTDWNKERLDTLKKIMPDIFTNEGKLNSDQLKKLVDPLSIQETERYEFRWFGKSKAKQEAFMPSNATLIQDERRSVNPNDTQNLIIEGENLEVLKLLSGSYREKIKCIYIDPPYNTGKDFVYSDNFSQDRKAYWEDAQVLENGVKIDTNVESDGRYHSNWLNMMYSRLLIARQLLREDGVIFISIDDNEVHHLRKLCDEVFGEDNFVSEIIWHSKYTTANDAKYVSRQHEYIIFYAKNKDSFEIGLLNRTAKMDEAYKNSDDDERGPWKPTPLHAKSGTTTYTITFDNGISWTPPKGRFPLYSKEDLVKLYNDNRLYFGKNGKNSPDEKSFLTEVKQGKTVGSVWSYLNVGSSHQANEEIADLIGKGIFDNPKTSKLIQTITKTANGEDSTILDFFSGSGTTGQAISELNQEDGGQRKYILVQIPEATDEKSEAYKAGYKKISDITIERNKRVIERIENEKRDKIQQIADVTQLIIEQEAEIIQYQKQNPQLPLQDTGNDKNIQKLIDDIIKNKSQIALLEKDIANIDNLDKGFKVFKLVKSNFPRVEFAPDPHKTDEQNIVLFKKYIYEKEAQLYTPFNRGELLTEILLKNNFTLNYSVTRQEQFKKNDIFHVTDGDKETLICLDVLLDMETVEYFKKNTMQKFICLERALDTTKKWNLKHYMGDKFKAF